MIEMSTVWRLLRAQRAGCLVVWIDDNRIMIACVGKVDDMTWRDALRRRVRYSEEQALELLDSLGVA